MQYLKTTKLWLSAIDLAAELGCARSTAYDYLARHVFGPPLKVRGSLRIHRDQVVATMKESLENEEIT